MKNDDVISGFLDASSLAHKAQNSCQISECLLALLIKCGQINESEALFSVAFFINLTFNLTLLYFFLKFLGVREINNTCILSFVRCITQISKIYLSVCVYIYILIIYMT